MATKLEHTASFRRKMLMPTNTHHRALIKSQTPGAIIKNKPTHDDKSPRKPFIIHQLISIKGLNDIPSPPLRTP